MGMPRTATKPQSAKIQNVVVNDRINYALTIQDKYRKRLKTCSTDQSRVTDTILQVNIMQKMDYFIYRTSRLQNNCSMKQKVLPDNIKGLSISGLKDETHGRKYNFSYYYYM